MAERRPPRVLIVDDQPEILRTLARLFGDQAVVQTATSGAEALACIEVSERFDLVLCDVMMPAMTGLELYDRIRALDADLAEAFVFTTGGIAPNEQARLERTGVRCIMKPCDVEELRKLIRR